MTLDGAGKSQRPPVHPVWVDCHDCGAGKPVSRSPRCEPCRLARKRALARERSREYAATLEGAALARRRRLRRRTYRAANPPEACIDCGDEVSGRNDSKRCAVCRPIWRRKLANERAAAYRRRRQEQKR